MYVIGTSDKNCLTGYLEKSQINIRQLIFKAIEKKAVILICGPTCSGKTAAALNIALLLNTDIISVDSMQVYKKMDIGTDKINTCKYGIRQYMTDIFKPSHHVTAVEFREKCRKIIENDFFSKNRIPLLAGGSGLYIRAVIDDLKFAVKKTANLPSRFPENTCSSADEYEKLKKVDPGYAKKISPNDSRRISGALQVYRKTGKPFSQFEDTWNKRESVYRTVLVGLTKEKNNLHECIENRVSVMFENGLIDEVKSLLSAGYQNCSSLMQAVGYKEVIRYLEGEATEDECRQRIVKNTKKLAKKQLTWFKADTRINWIRADYYDNIIYLIGDIIKIIWKDLDNE
ncbi:MAG: tRNA (adenosine(37)-N6)-dimethylallyltransferase MiaA [Actinobacteria bacterium]|nr:tRNA (adenosine(37)-N6)-dimethylallyltransferase MiaA [Actinomycetota bacterium]